MGRPGRRALKALLPEIIEAEEIDFTIANAENAAGGMGVTAEVVEELLSLGIDVLTTGNHVWKNRNAYDIISSESRLLRPANYPEGAPGQGGFVYRPEKTGPVAVLNLQGRVFMDAIDCPFQVASKEVERLSKEARVLIVDMHAEATSEKVAMAWFLDGRVSAVLGTHTHVQTADERLFPKGTAYISDAGMTGPYDSVIGVKHELIVERFIKRLPNKFELASGTVQFNAVVLTIDNESGKPQTIRRVQRLIGPA